MARCWTCGSPADHWRYTCLSCQRLSEIQRLRRDLETGSEAVLERFGSLAAEVQQLRHDVSEGMAAIASAIEWGFEEISWQLEQQTALLKSIDHTLKTPAQTQANELRAIGDELRARGVLDEAERRFLQALDLNPLDYRTYVSLAHTYLRSDRFDEARSALEKSLPHAPRGRKPATKLPAPRRMWEGKEQSEEDEEAEERIRLLSQLRTCLGGGPETAEEQPAGPVFDWRSYSYRLIGRIHACRDDYGSAVICLRSAIEYSPAYAEGHYDYAQYCSQTGNEEPCLAALRNAISAAPLYWHLAHHERNFDPLRTEVEGLLVNIRTDACGRAEGAISNAQSEIARAREAISEAEQAFHASREKGALDSIRGCQEAEARLELAKSKVASGDYQALLDAERIAGQAHALAGDASSAANKERDHYRERRRRNVRRAWGRVPGAVYAWPQLFALIGMLVPGLIPIGAIASGVGAEKPFETGAALGGLAGAVAGLAFGLRNIWKELHGEVSD